MALNVNKEEFLKKNCENKKENGRISKMQTQRRFIQCGTCRRNKKKKKKRIAL